MLAFIILIIFFVYIYNTSNTIKKLQEENKKLKNFIKNKAIELNLSPIEKTQIEHNKVPENSLNNRETVNNSITENKVLENKLNHTVIENKALENNVSKTNIKPEILKEKKQLTEEERKQIATKKEKAERERKNTTILIVGAILIVLAAIVFLMSTWDIIPNLLKTAVLVLLIGVFYGGSKIAKEKFNLEKTSSTFFYIAMAYIPICLFSISFFRLLGDYLSLNGEGKYIYLSAVGIITSIIYFLTYKNSKNQIIFYGSLLSQVFSVVLFSLIFSDSYELISLNLLLYNILFMLLTSNTNNKLITNIKYVYSILPYVSTFIICFSLENVNILIPINLILLAINYCILEAKEKRKSHAYLFNISISIFGIYSIWNNPAQLTESSKMILTLIYFVLVYVLENIILIGKNKKELKTSLAVITITMLQLLFFKIYDYEELVLRPYVVSLIQSIITFFTYVNAQEKGKNITSALLPIYFIITGCIFLEDLNSSYHYYIVFSLITFIFGEALQKEKVSQLREKSFLISNIFIATMYCSTLFDKGNEFINDVIYFILLFAVYAYSYLRYKKTLFKYLSYTAGHLVLVSACIFFKISEDFMFLIPTITLIGLLNLEKNIEFLKDSSSVVFFNILKVIAYVFLTILGDALGTIFTLSLTAYLIYYNYRNEEQYYNNIIPLIGAMPSVFDNSLEPTLQICIMLISTVGLTVFSVRERKINIYTIFSGIYMFFTLNEMDVKYINEILFIIWSSYNWYFMKEAKQKDVFKFLSYLGALGLYNVLAKDLQLTEYTVFDMFGYIAFAILVIRDILVNYMKDIDVLEGITFVCIYLIAITSYSNEADGMLFGILIVGIVFFSYIKKYGVLFLTSIAAILVNVLLLTREFWFSIPWWIYLLVIGSLLITFAIKNEVNEKNNKLDIGSTLKKIKDKIEK